MTNYTLSSLHVKSLSRPEYNYLSYQSTSMLCKSSLEASLLSCTSGYHISCDVSVTFLNACYVGFGPVFFCTNEECKPLINLSGSPQGHPRFDVLATPCGVHVAHGHSTHAEAFTLLKSYRCNHQGIHCVAIIPSHSSIIRRTHP